MLKILEWFEDLTRKEDPLEQEKAGEDQPEKESRSERRILPASCSSCGSSSLRKVSDGEYVCEFCGSRFFVGEPDEAGDAEEADADLAAVFEKAAGYEERDDYKNELRTLAKGLDIAPNDCTLMLKIGRAYWRLGFIKKAVEYYRKAEELDPDDPIVYVNLGALYLSQDQYKMAKPLFEKGIAIIEADPLSASPGDTAVTYGNYALCIGKLGDREGAKHYLEIATEKGYNRSSVDNVKKKLRL